MKKNMYFDTQRAKVYKDDYRPSSNIYRFLRTVMLILVEGHSPSGNYHYSHYTRRKR